MKLHRMGLLIGVLMLGTVVFAQTATTTSTAPTSAVNWFWAICDTKAVVDLDGTLINGDAVYVQFFREAGASGAALSDVLKVAATGTFKTSQVANYPSGTLLALGQFGSMRISIASASDATNVSFTQVVDDVYDTCINPSNAVGSVTSAGSTTLTTLTVDPVTGVVVSAIAGQPIRSSGILKPGGGYLNEVYAVPQEAPVQIGARPSLNNRELGRSSNPGLIFAECNQYAGAEPGRIFDTDNLTVYWSWFAKTAEQVRDHIAKAQYFVLFESPGLPSQPFANVGVSPIVRREDGNFYVFYSVNIGTAYLPGTYRVNYEVNWSEPTNDGYDDFGPGTVTERLIGNCTWNIEKNPYGVTVNYSNPQLFSK